MNEIEGQREVKQLETDIQKTESRASVYNLFRSENIEGKLSSTPSSHTPNPPTHSADFVSSVFPHFNQDN